MPAIYETTEEQPLTSHLSNALKDVPLAEVHSIPSNRIVSIEHPCIIHNLENGLKSMGGEPRMKHILDHHVGDSLLTPQKPKPEPELGVSLQPNNPLASKLVSVGVDTRNVLVKIALPKRTGRKRKRGSQKPFEMAEEDTTAVSMTAPELLKRLRDNESSYTVKAMGLVHETHRFRGLPDFQNIANDIPIFRELTAHVLPTKWSTLKEFALDPATGIPTMTAFPGPPTFASASQPYRYEYQQAAGVRFSRDEEGKIRSINMQAPARKMMKRVQPDVETVPKKMPPALKPHNPYSKFLPKVVEGLKKLLEDRPLVTRRVAMNTMADCNETVFREATQWVSYSFTAGPFRDTLIKYGVDPRKDPKYRKYQTLMFQLDRRAAKASGETSGKWNRSARHIATEEDNEKSSHIFDGESVSANGKTWQICDLTDPVLKRIFDTDDINKECDVHTYGWYSESTICRARVIMREKMEKLFEGKPVPHDVYDLIADLPDNIDEFTSEHAQAYFGDKPGAREAASLAAELRSMVRAGRVSNRRMLETKGARGDTADGEAAEGAEVEEMRGDLDDWDDEQQVQS